VVVLLFLVALQSRAKRVFDFAKMPKSARSRKFAEVKKQIRPSQALEPSKKRKKKKGDPSTEIRYVERTPTSMFFAFNESMRPPYHILVDTNFINFSIRNKIDMVDGFMDCLFAKCIPVILDSVMAELEKLGEKYRVALRLAKDPRFLRMTGYLEKGTYADDDIVMMVRQHRCFIVATCDRDLRRRLRKIPGVPIMYISNHKYTIERLPESLGGAK